MDRCICWNRTTIIALLANFEQWSLIHLIKKRGSELTCADVTAHVASNSDSIKEIDRVQILAYFHFSKQKSRKYHNVLSRLACQTGMNALQVALDLRLGDLAKSLIEGGIDIATLNGEVKLLIVSLSPFCVVLT